MLEEAAFSDAEKYGSQENKITEEQLQWTVTTAKCNEPNYANAVEYIMHINNVAFKIVNRTVYFILFAQ